MPLAFRTRSALLVFAVSAVACDRGPSFTVEAGIVTLCMHGEQPTLRMRERTTRVPVKLPEWDSLGFSVRSSGSEPFTVSTKHYLPGVPQSLPPEVLALGYTPEDALSGIEFPAETVEGGRWFTFRLELGDPVGLYKIDVMINGKTHDTLEFEVVPSTEQYPKEFPPPECPESAAQQGAAADEPQSAPMDR